MGIDQQRFTEPVDEELVCPICKGVYESPIQLVNCEHTFCQSCIETWLQEQTVCPIDRQETDADQFEQVPRIMRNMLSRLQLTCENAANGCKDIIKLDCIETHVASCISNPHRLVQCERDCGISIPLDEVQNHNCVGDLRNELTKALALITSMSQEMTTLRSRSLDLTRDVTILKDRVLSIRPDRAISSRAANTDRFRELQTELEKQEMIRWAQLLPMARVTRWGGMISTPDAVLQSVIKRALQESGCSVPLAAELMENSHERRWPPGLCTLETRQLHRRHYDSYVVRRIPGKQAVVVMSFENRHVHEGMVAEPGIVMIFAHGVEG